MDTERVLANQTVLIKGGQIVAIGPVKQVKVPARATRIDGRGKFLIPGLGDMHVHLTDLSSSEAANGKYDAAVERRLFLLLAQGITTVRNLDYLSPMDWSSAKLEGEDLLRLRARVAAGELLSPRIYTSGPWGPRRLATDRRGGGGRRATTTPDSVAAYVAAYKAEGYDFLKIHDEDFAIFDSVIVAARRVGLTVIGHPPGWEEARKGKIGRLEQLTRTLASGMKSIEHMAGYWGAMRAWGDADGRCPMTDSLALMQAGPRRACEWEGIRVLAEMTQRAGVWVVPTPPPPSSTVETPAPGYLKALVKGLQDVEAGLLLGTDYPTYSSDPRSLHFGLQWLVLQGLTPYQALVVGTRNVAVYLGTLDEAGTVAAGKRADLVLLQGNPLQDITHTMQPVGVMFGGRWLPRVEIDQRLADANTVAVP